MGGYEIKFNFLRLLFVKSNYTFKFLEFLKNPRESEPPFRSN